MLNTATKQGRLKSVLETLLVRIASSAGLADSFQDNVRNTTNRFLAAANVAKVSEAKAQRHRHAERTHWKVSALVTLC